MIETGEAEEGEEDTRAGPEGVVGREAHREEVGNAIEEVCTL